MQISMPSFRRKRSEVPGSHRDGCCRRSGVISEKSHILFAKATKKPPLLRTCTMQHSGQSAAQCRDIHRSAGISILPDIMQPRENRSNGSLSPSDAYLKTAEFMNFSNYAFILLPAFTIQNHRPNPYTGFYRFDEYVLVRKFSAFLLSPRLALRHSI